MSTRKPNVEALDGVIRDWMTSGPGAAPMAVYMAERGCLMVDAPTDEELFAELGKRRTLTETHWADEIRECLRRLTGPSAVQAQPAETEIVTALQAFLREYQGRMLAPDGACMKWHDGRPVVLDVLAARETLARLRGAS